MKQGAYDYLLKPFDIHSLQRTVERGIERRRLHLENAHLSEAVALYQLSHAATSDTDSGELFRLALNAIQAEFGPEWSVVYSLDGNDSIEQAAHRGVEPALAHLP